MKKSKFLAFGLCTILLFTASFTGCSNDSVSSSSDSSPASSSTGNPSGGTAGGGTGGGTTNNGGSSTAGNNATGGGGTGTGGSTDSAGGNTGSSGNTTIPVATITEAKVAEFQTAITNATAGSTVNLAAGTVPANSKISIGKALTVDGKGIEGLTVELASAVSSSVVLKNFKKATIKIAAPAVSSSIRAARGADTPAAGSSGTTTTDSTELQKFKKFGDDSLPLFLEGCSIEKFEVEKDVALYLGKGEEKTEIKELELKKGVEDFTFIELDEKETNLYSKSKVEKLSIEDDGIEKINLIGGTFGDVTFADNFAGEVDFKYDKEFSDQFEKKDFFNEQFIEAKDVAIAEDKSAGGSIYKFTMTRQEFERYNGGLDVIFLTQDQANAITTSMNGSLDYMNLITCAAPAYDMSLMGGFTVAKDSNGEISNGLYAVYGSSETFFDYSNIERDANGYPVVGVNGFAKTVTLDKYMTYSKEAIVIEVGTDSVDIYLNKNAIRKSDLLLCSGYGRSSGADGKSEGGTKLSIINLEGYVPYFAIHSSKVMQSMSNGVIQGESTALSNSTPVSGFVELPTADKSTFGRDYLPYSMQKASSYPNVSSVVYPDITINNVKVIVRYYNDALTFQSQQRLIRDNVSPLVDNYEYYLDENFTDLVYCYGETVPWDEIYAAKQWTTTNEATLYARPRRAITLTFVGLNPPPERLAEIRFGESYISIGMDAGKTAVALYKNYNSTTKECSNPITNPKDIENNSTVYVIEKYVKVVAIGKNSGTANVELTDNYRTAMLCQLMTMEGSIFKDDVYKTASISGAKHTVESLRALDLGATVYTITPEIIIDPVYENVETSQNAYVQQLKSGTKTTFADLYAQVQTASATTCYHKTFNTSTNTWDFNECTKTYLDNLIKTDSFNPFGTIEVFTSNQNSTI